MSLMARTVKSLASCLRSTGAALEKAGRNMEVTKYKDKLVPSTRFVAIDDLIPRVADETFVAPSASIIGDVEVGKYTSVWYGAVVRGDVNSVKIGEGTSIGDRAVVHVAKIQGDFPTVIGNHVTVGSGALVHAATLGNGVVLGDAAQVLDGAVVGDNAMITAGSVVTPGTKVPEGELWGGAPAKKIRALTAEEIAMAKTTALEQIELASEHNDELNKDYKTVQEEMDDRHYDEMVEEGFIVSPQSYANADVLGQGMPGRIFRNTLTHPHLKKFDEN